MLKVPWICSYLIGSTIFPKYFSILKTTHYFHIERKIYPYTPWISRDYNIFMKSSQHLPQPAHPYFIKKLPPSTFHLVLQLTHFTLSAFPAKSLCEHKYISFESLLARGPATRWPSPALPPPPPPPRGWLFDAENWERARKMSDLRDFPRPRRYNNNVLVACLSILFLSLRV